MNDEFLKSFRKAPETGYLEKLQVRIRTRERQGTLRKRLLWSLASVVLALGLSIAGLPSVRAGIMTLIEEVAGFKFDVTDVNPYMDDPVQIIPARDLTLEEARREFASPISLPAYLPAGCSLESVQIWNETSDMPVLYLTWAGTDRLFTLQIYHMAQAEDFRQMVGAGALEEVLVGGQPAVVVRGAWNVDTQEYDVNGMIALIWKYDDGTIYSLSGVEPMMPPDELIRIAESIP